MPAVDYNCGQSYIGDAIAAEIADRVDHEVDVGMSSHTVATSDPRFDLVKAGGQLQIRVAPFRERIVNAFRNSVMADIDIGVGLVKQMGVIEGDYNRDTEFQQLKAAAYHIAQWGWRCMNRGGHPDWPVIMSTCPALFDSAKAKEGIFLTVVMITVRASYDKLATYPPELPT